MAQYLFSYGSLINPESLAHTINSEKAKKAKLITIEGFERGWRNQVHPERRTGLGIIPKNGAKVNGVVFEVLESELDQLDKREYGFTRMAITHPDFESLWCYSVSEPKAPTEQFPIVLSYVDTILAGCLVHSMAFAEEFIQSTVNWEFPFVNDRLHPRFPRRVTLPENKIKLIDELLEKHIGFLPKIT